LPSVTNNNNIHCFPYHTLGDLKMAN